MLDDYLHGRDPTDGIVGRLTLLPQGLPSACSKTRPVSLSLSCRLVGWFLSVFGAVRDREQAIELGNIPEALPSLSGSSRWSLGSLSILPTSGGPTSCMSDGAEDESENVVRCAMTSSHL